MKICHVLSQIPPDGQGVYAGGVDISLSFIKCRKFRAALTIYSIVITDAF